MTEYVGPERRRESPRPVVIPRRAAVAIAAALWLAIMLPLGMVLFYGWRSDDRATRSQTAACTLIELLDAQQVVLDRHSQVMAVGLQFVSGTYTPDERDLLQQVVTEMREAEKHNAAVLAVIERHDLPCG